MTMDSQSPVRKQDGALVGGKNCIPHPVPQEGVKMKMFPFTMSKKYLHINYHHYFRWIPQAAEWVLRAGTLISII